MKHANDDRKRPDTGKPRKAEPGQKRTKDELDDELVEALEGSFPASDPASVTRSTHPGRPNDKPRKRG